MTERRFTVFARPADDGHTPVFMVMDRNVACSNAGFTMQFSSRDEAQAEADRRENSFSAPDAFRRAQWDSEAAR